jgi:creatinine amidohydrolase
MRKSDPAGDMHAGERETSTLLYLRPDLVQDGPRHPGVRGEPEAPVHAGPLQRHLVVRGFPNHYAGEGATATRELGQVLTEARIAALVRALRSVKADTQSLTLQKEFFDRVREGREVTGL